MAKTHPQSLFFDSPREKSKRRFWKVIFALALVTLAYRSFIFDIDNGLRGIASSSAETCAQPYPAAKPSNYSNFYSSPSFRFESAKRLSGAIQIPTMTYDDMGPVGKDERWAPFPGFHQYLRDTFPVLHKEANTVVVGGYSLVYTIEGSESLKPLMLTAHQDVVPAVSSLDRWTYPPFEGVIEGEWIYGRGAGDCKNNLIGIMTAVEHLLISGWKPRRTLLLAFGQDEEISGPRGAVSISKHLEEIYGKDGIVMIVDEGGMGLDTEFNTEFALPGVAEKGYMNAVIEVDMLGGHSSMPSSHTSIGILSKIVSAVEDSTVFKPHLKKSSPIWGYLSCISQHGDESAVPSWIKKAVSAKNPDMVSVAKKFAKSSLSNRYLVQTSKAATLFKAGVKVNALPESAIVTFNSRIEIFSSPEEVIEIYVDLVKPIAKKYGLTLNGEVVSSNSLLGNITVRTDGSSNPSSISSFSLDSEAWSIFSKAVQASFGPDVISAPSAMTGNTDTRHYWNLSSNIYRWSPTRTGTKLNIHTVDEKLKIDTHVEGILFYTELILQSDTIKDGFRL